MVNSSQTHPQNDFMNAARKERKRVEIYLVNGIRLTGLIESFDQYLVMLRTPIGVQGIYKRAISTIQLDMGTRSPRAPHPHAQQRYGAPESEGRGGSAREFNEFRSPRRPNDPFDASPPYEQGERSERSERSADNPVVVTRRRRLFTTTHTGNTNTHNDE